MDENKLVDNLQTGGRYAFRELFGCQALSVPGGEKNRCCPGRGFERIKEEVGLTGMQNRRLEEKRGKLHAEQDSLVRLLELERFVAMNKFPASYHKYPGTNGGRQVVA